MSQQEQKNLGASTVARPRAGDCAIGLQPLIQAYAALRDPWPHAWPGLPRVVDGALNWLCAGTPVLRDARSRHLHRSLVAAAHIVEQVGAMQARQGAEPPYHNRLHMADTVVGMAALLRARREWAQYLSRSLEHTELLCLLAMVIHDFQHDGRINEAPGEMERLSLQRFLPHARAIGLSLEDWTTVTRLVINTDPATVGQLHEEFRRFEPAPGAALDLREMAVLVTEADVLASVLPNTGRQLGQSLTREWVRHHPERAARVTTPEGRLGFLALGARFSSPASRHLGVPGVVQAQVNELSVQIQRRPSAS